VDSSSSSKPLGRVVQTWTRTYTTASCILRSAISSMYVFSILLCWQIYVSATPPSIVFIVIDDLGFNDISLHGSPQIPTPNMDEIGLDGLTFMRYYAQPVCSPTRATIMSGRHVIHTGIYTPFESGGTKLHLDTSYTLLPRYLERAANYTSHGVGKWHLGFNSMNATPTSRGFLTHHGYWDGAEDYTSHNVSTKNGSSVYDFYNNTLPVPQYLGEWSTTVFAARAVEIIEQHAAAADGTPLFLYTAFQNVHWPLEAPDNYIARFANSTGGVKQRNLVCAMAAFADDGVGNITAALKRVGMWDNTLVVLVSDNGGPTHLDEGTWSSNFPLRGGKNTLWEGGTRVVGLIRGPGVPMGAVSHAPIHASDWLPTLVSMATGGRDFRDFSPPGEPPYQEGDGLDVWSSIASGGAEPHARNWVLLETHPTSHAYNDTVHGHSLIVGDWKYLTMGPDMESHDDEDGCKCNSLFTRIHTQTHTHTLSLSHTHTHTHSLVYACA